MQQFNNLSKVMDAETILKNSASLSNKTSRGAFSSIFKKAAIVAIMATMSVAAYAQNRMEWGVQAGVNFSKFSNWITDALERHEEFEIKRKPGFQLEIFGDLPFRGNQKMGHQFEFGFTQLGTKIEEKYSEWDWRDRRDIPIREVGTIGMNCFYWRYHIRFKHDFDENIALTLHAGPHLAYSLWSNLKYEKFVNNQKVDDDSNNFFDDDVFGRAADTGIGAGAAITIKDTFRVGVCYDLGIMFHRTAFTLTYIFGK